MMALISTVRDTHANLWGSLGVRPPVGDSQLPVIVRFISGHPVVAGILEPPGGKPSGLPRGDAIETIDGQSVEELVAAWSPYYAASNEPTRQRDMARSMGRGPAKPARIGVRRDGAAIEVEAARWPGAAMTRTGDYQHDLPGPTFRLLSPSVAYLKLSSVKADDCGSYVEQARGTRGWIIDARNYPSEFVVFDLGSHLVKEPTEFARITVGNLMNPGEFSFAKAIALSPRPPHYEGKIVVLVDEITQSQGEYTAMAFRSAPGAVVIGSTTAGADGDVAAIPLPGGLKTMMSGVGIFYPDRRPTQRVGIVPDIRVNPTLEGIRAGRDEVLERALKVILGPDTATEEIQRLGTLHE
jgi:C-terminal processing protease CtpA/Prc